MWTNKELKLVYAELEQAYKLYYN